MRRTLLALAGITFAAGCSSGPAGNSALSAPGAEPRPSTAMVCQKAQERKIAAYVGESARISAPTWVDHRYSCKLIYPDGVASLSVKELGSWQETKDYYAALVARAGRTVPVRNMGQAGAQAADGRVFVRKDFSVLTVDPSGLPSQFGRPPTSASDIAYTMADLIMACWSGE